MKPSVTMKVYMQPNKPSICADWAIVVSSTLLYSSAQVINTLTFRCAIYRSVHAVFLATAWFIDALSDDLLGRDRQLMGTNLMKK
jgi:hypothetical protein